MKSKGRRTCLFLITGMFSGFVWFYCTDFLVSIRFLNTKDLVGVAGAEKGTFSDYLLNAWVWDFFGLFFVATSGICAIALLVMLILGKIR